MKRLTVLIVITLITSFQANSQRKKVKDQKAIKSMCGCYEVGFNFAETFQYSKDPDYKPSKIKHDKALEWVQLVADEKNKIVMQHLLIVGPSSKRTVIKHWRQDWLYENTDFYMFNGNNVWNYKKLPKSAVRKQWTQKVYQVDDSPRYEGTATWIHADGKSYWENATDAPLPRREYTKRNDYNVTVRTNKHVITNEGWVHDQDNNKVIRQKGKQDIILAQEKGYNTYKKVADSKCKAAQDWWKKNASNWTIIRTKWDEVFNNAQNLQLEKKVDGKPLYRYLFSKDFNFTESKVSELIDSFVIK
ncbi:DUF6607 family protein [Flavobacteriaceae bacterium S356]|uniref:DUF6607 family protein n=1 Tax=Asprobacillus argus TaxID=3076534 RepID=A0ABU3LGP7_9FLAO|nr:DUF6607 family protein [Flavobacteriaceae bacterium S356]